MKILVTGGAGFIGSHVVDAMVEAGHEVVVVDDLSSGRPSNLNPAATFYELDIRSLQLHEVFEREKPEVVNHHAAQIDVRRSVADPHFDAEVNVLGSLKLLELAREFKVRKVIYISSGGAIYGEPDYLPCDEQHPVRPLAPYGASKYAGELYLHMYKEVHGLDYTVLRYANVYGPRQDPHGEAGVVAIFTGQMLAGQPVTINGSGDQVRDFIYVAECARANVQVLTQGSGRVYNLGSGVGTTINEIFANLNSVTHYDRQPVHGPPKPGETFKIYLDSRLAATELNWRPEVSLEAGLERTVEYFRQRENDKVD